MQYAKRIFSQSYVHILPAGNMPTDPMHVMSQGVCSGPHWRTTRAVFYGENVQWLSHKALPEGNDIEVFVINVVSYNLCKCTAANQLCLFV